MFKYDFASRTLHASGALLKKFTDRTMLKYDVDDLLQGRTDVRVDLARIQEITQVIQAGVNRS